MNPQFQNGKKTDIISLPEEYSGKKQSDILHEIDPPKVKENNLLAPVNRVKERELEIGNTKTSDFVVHEVLYAKDPLIIDTKEKFRQESDNAYLKKIPLKTRLDPLLTFMFRRNQLTELCQSSQQLLQFYDSEDTS